MARAKTGTWLRGRCGAQSSTPRPFSGMWGYWLVKDYLDKVKDCWRRYKEILNERVDASWDGEILPEWKDTEALVAVKEEIRALTLYAEDISTVSKWHYAFHDIEPPCGAYHTGGRYPESQSCIEVKYDEATQVLVLACRHCETAFAFIAIASKPEA